MPNYEAPVTPVSPKAVAGAVGGILLPLLFVIVNAIANALSTDPTFLQDLPTVWRQLILVVLAGIGAGAAAYAKTDPLRYHPADAPVAPPVDDQAVIDPELPAEPEPFDPEAPGA